MELHSENPDDHWIIGACIVVIGSILSNFGVNLQKAAHSQKKKLDVRLLREGVIRKNLRPYYRLPFWIAGLAMIIIGSLADFVGLYFAPQSLVAPLGSITLIANVVFARFFLKEEVRLSHYAATCVVLVGAIFTTFSADHSDPNYTLHQMIYELFPQPYFLLYMAALATLTTVLGVGIVSARKSLKDNVNCSKSLKYLAFAYAALSGVFGSLSVLSGKIMASIIKQIYLGDLDVLRHLATYVAVAILGITVFSQTHFMNLGLQDYDAVIIFPIFQVSWILFSTLGGLIFFQELSHLSTPQSLWFTAAMSMILFGVYILGRNEMKQILALNASFTGNALVLVFIAKLKKQHRSKALEEGQAAQGRKSLPRAHSLQHRSVGLKWCLLGAEAAILHSQITSCASLPEPALCNEERVENLKASSSLPVVA